MRLGIPRRKPFQGFQHACVARVCCRVDNALITSQLSIRSLSKTSSRPKWFCWHIIVNCLTHEDNSIGSVSATLVFVWTLVRHSLSSEIELWPEQTAPAMDIFSHLLRFHQAFKVVLPVFLACDMVYSCYYVSILYKQRLQVGQNRQLSA